MISSTAWIAPAAFIACNMEMQSRGVAPTAFNAPTISDTFVVAGKTIELDISSSVRTSSVRVTIVVPYENGFG